MMMASKDKRLLEVRRVDGGTDELRLRIVSKFLKEKRVMAGLTQWDVASALKYTTAQFVSNWERGVSLPPLETLPKLAELFGVPGREFIAVMSRYQDAVHDRDEL